MVIGWRVNAKGDPVYWASHKGVPRPGLEPLSALELVGPDRMTTGTLIVAQSGSGKSSFLARTVEELMLSSKANCLIIDPNSDFRFFYMKGHGAEWRDARYNRFTHSGRLHTEASVEVFDAQWTAVRSSMTVLVGREVRDEPDYVRKAMIRWHSIPVDFLSEGLDSVHKAQMIHCHSFFQTLATVAEEAARMKAPAGQIPSEDVIADVQRVFTSVSDARQRAEGQFTSDDAAKQIQLALDTVVPLPSGMSYADLEGLVQRADPSRWNDAKEARRHIAFFIIFRSILRASVAFNYFDYEIGKHYFGLLQQYQSQGIFRTKIEDPRAKRVEILDLPSVPNQATRHLLVISQLDLVIKRAREEWERALAPREEGSVEETPRPDRHPLFIVVDEAHNLMPSNDLTTDPLLALVRDRFRMIAAEGRKLGLFLILATQRPDKIDRFVLSECGNHAIMRLDSEKSVGILVEQMGLQDYKRAIHSLCCGPGFRVLLLGKWARGETLPLYPAPRRTMEGGGSIQDSEWVIPPSAPHRSK